jgi:RHS repeat-associated protein
MTQAAQPSIVFVVNFTYDALGRTLSETGPVAYTTYEYDPAGRRTRLHFNNGGPSMHYDHLVTGELAAIRENGATSGAGVLATFGYDSLGRRTSLTRGNGAVTSYTYDSVSRLASQSEDLAGTSHDQSSTFTFNPAGQIASVTRSNDTYAFTGHANASRTDTHNGLNQVTASGSTGISHDGRGNTDGIGSAVYVYDLDNRLREASGGAVLNYDPLGRLTNSYDYNDIAGTIDYFARDGARIIGEAASGGGIARRYVYGEGLDEVLVQYEGSGTSDRRWLHADERGSIVAVSDGTGAVTAVNRYDEYGNPQGGTIAGRFGYTGQAWLPELGMWYYKARVYNPGAPEGRFMQADPIGYGDGMNVYAYVRGDPINLIDPLGLDVTDPDIIVTCDRVCQEAQRERDRAETSEFLRQLNRDWYSRRFPPSDDNRFPVWPEPACNAPLLCGQPPVPVPPPTACVNPDGSVSSDRRGSNIPLFGDVWAAGGQVAAGAGGGGAVETGRWYDRHTGASGTYATTSMGAASPGAGAGVNVTNFSDLSSFSGVAWGASGATPVVGVGGSQSTNGQWGHSVFVGIGTPRASLMRGNTTITSGLPKC